MSLKLSGYLSALWYQYQHAELPGASRDVVIAVSVKGILICSEHLSCWSAYGQPDELLFVVFSPASKYFLTCVMDVGIRREVTEQFP